MYTAIHSEPDYILEEMNSQFFLRNLVVKFLQCGLE